MSKALSKPRRAIGEAASRALKAGDALGSLGRGGLAQQRLRHISVGFLTGAVCVIDLFSLLLLLMARLAGGIVGHVGCPFGYRGVRT
ncbi:hypothetical protein [Citreimonas salinaria]|uniref:hypothetical protein n=1 Tax=Citreimonas salinaria TaxID=321339 RepID=UPI000B7F4B72|nr:hypothetical protein [Citreimonas salinaria]